MPWKFDATLGDLVFVVVSSGEVSDPANLSLGENGTSDLEIDTGERVNDGSVLDQGLRIIEI
jgi:hypothetical protein